MFHWLRHLHSAVKRLFRVNRAPPATVDIVDDGERRTVWIRGWRGVGLLVETPTGMRLVNERQACDREAFRAAWRAWSRGAVLTWEE